MTGPISRHLAAEKYVIFASSRADTCLFLGIATKNHQSTTISNKFTWTFARSGQKKPHLVASDIVRVNNVNTHSHLQNTLAIKTHRFSTNVHLQLRRLWHVLLAF